MNHSSTEAMQKLDDIYRRGAEALEDCFMPGTALHVGIDWQRFYCDPTFPLGHCNTYKMQFNQKIGFTLARMNEFAQAVREVLPSAWVYHDFPVRHDFQQDIGVLYGLESEDQVQQKLKVWKEQAHALCAAVSGQDKIFGKNDFNAYSNPQFLKHAREHDYKIHLLSGLIRSHCVRESEYHGHRHRFKMFVIDDLTVDGYAYAGPAHLQIAKDADSRGTNLVRAEDVRRIVTKAQRPSV